MMASADDASEGGAFDGDAECEQDVSAIAQLNAMTAADSRNVSFDRRQGLDNSRSAWSCC